ncbi:MAG: hydrolase [Paenibacillus sp.]|jgi:8-oxo-dGTP diphosphatase|nr:hydrolase [Paenibacillus sp.]
MEFRLIAAAILFNGNDVLMMKRSERRTLNPGLWATVGGHVEGYELANPIQACVREITEETGFEPQDVHELTLRYILMRNNRGEFRQQFIYVGSVTRRDFHQTDEGELHWIPFEELLNRPLPYIFRATLEHFQFNRFSPHVWFGSAIRSLELDEPLVIWTPLTDPMM